MGNVISSLMTVWGALPSSLQEEVRKKIPPEVKQAHQIVSSILNPVNDENKLSPSDEKNDDDIIEAEWTEVPKGPRK